MNSHRNIYQSKVNIIFAFIAISSMTAFFVFVSTFSNSKKKGFGLGSELDFWLFIVIALTLALLQIKVIYMMLKMGAPIATLDASGITPRNQKTIPWGQVEGMALQSVDAAFFKVRSDLVVHLRKGKVKIPYVKLTQQGLADLIEEVRK